MLIEIIFYFSLVFTSMVFFISIYNLLTAPQLKKREFGSKQDLLVSVLIPARNEEKNISDCIDSVLDQTYSRFELIILDDESEDDTAKIISEKISAKSINENIRMISGKPLNEGWLGKNWACHQLSLEAKGEVLLFVDADVRLNPEAIESCISFKDIYNLDLITSFPTQKIKSFGEWLIVPLMNFLLLAFLPLKKVYSSTNKSFIAANGQFLFITKTVYTKMGGHKAFKEKVVEDMEIARYVKKSGFKVMTFLGNNSVSCRMYEGFGDAFQGFSKNFFPGFNTSPFVFSFFLIFILIVFFLPFPMIMVNYDFLLIVLIILSGRLIISVCSKQNFLINTILHPLQMVVMIAVGVNSVYRATTKKLKWKGRYI